MGLVAWKITRQAEFAVARKMNIFKIVLKHVLERMIHQLIPKRQRSCISQGVKQCQPTRKWENRIFTTDLSPFHTQFLAQSNITKAMKSTSSIKPEESTDPKTVVQLLYSHNELLQRSSARCSLKSIGVTYLAWKLNRPDWWTFTRGVPALKYKFLLGGFRYYRTSKRRVSILSSINIPHYDYSHTFPNYLSREPCHNIWLLIGTRVFNKMAWK